MNDGQRRYPKNQKKGNRNAVQRRSPRSSGGPKGTLQPDPRQIFPHRRLGGVFAPGAALATGVAISMVIAVGALLRFRVRFAATAAGTLKVEFLSPDNTDTAYTQNQPATVAIVGGTPNKLDVDPHYGEGLIRLTYTPSANGAMTYADISGV